MTNHRHRLLLAFLLAIAALAELMPSLLRAEEPPTPAAAPSGDDDADDDAPAKKEISPAVLKFWSGVRLLDNTNPDEIARGRADLQASANLEFSHAQLELGRYLLNGARGFKKDARKGANLFILAAERGNAYAMVAAGQCLYAGIGVRKDQAKAEHWLQSAVAENADYSRPEPPPAELEAAEKATAPKSTVAGEIWTDPALTARANANFLLGQMELARKDFASAHQHFVAAASIGTDGRDGNYQAATQAALDFAFGQGTERDAAKAKEMLEHSRTLSKRLGASVIQSGVQSKWIDEFATADIEEALSTAGELAVSQTQFEIAERMTDRKSKDYDPKEAAFWYEVAAENGQAWPMMSLALLLGGTELGTPDPVAAFQWWKKAGEGEKPKHTLAVANLAICYQNGIGTERDTAKAAALFESQKDHNILCYLGSIGAAPTTVQTFEQQIRLLETYAKKGDASAQYMMGLRYRDGWDVKADRRDAESWFKKAAKSKHAGAIRELGNLAESESWASIAELQKNIKRAMERFNAASELGDNEATISLAHMYQIGRGTKADPMLAEQYYRKAIARNPKASSALNNLAIIEEERLKSAISAGGKNVDALRATMLLNFESAADLGLPLAAENLGYLYSEGKFVPQDFDKAYEYFDKAADGGIADAHYQLGLMHENGQGVPVTLTEAAYHYRLAAVENHRAALTRLINFYITGRGVDVDWDMASFWLLKAINLGDLTSAVTFADLELRRGNAENAVNIFRKLADLPSDVVAGFACERLAKCYTNGTGVKANPRRAKKYFNRAVELENGDALTTLAQEYFTAKRTKDALDTMTKASKSSAAANYFLGQMYYFGTNVDKDPAKAITFMRKAAQWNHPKAMYFLAALTYNHDANAPSLDEALVLAESAEKMGLPEAHALHEKLENRRDQFEEHPEQVARARSG